MNILLTNDDGYDFPSIIDLQEELQAIANVYIVAPFCEKSASSQALSIQKEMKVIQHNEFTYSVEGYPVDCVNVAIYSGLLDITFDLVVSGINKGPNMGEDTFYSGTVGAARHAYMHEIPAIAISTDIFTEEGDFTHIAKFIKNFIVKNKEVLKKPILLNINYPEKAKNAENIKWVRLGKRFYREDYSIKKENNNSYIVSLDGTPLHHKADKNSDFDEFVKGYITISVLLKDATDFEMMKILQQKIN